MSLATRSVPRSSSRSGPHPAAGGWEEHLDALEGALGEIRADHAAGRIREQHLPEPADGLGPLPLHLEGRARRLLTEIEAVEEMALADAESLAVATAARSRRPAWDSAAPACFVDRRA